MLFPLRILLLCSAGQTVSAFFGASFFDVRRRFAGLSTTKPYHYTSQQESSLLWQHTMDYFDGKENLDISKRRKIHKKIQAADPEWYQKYVIGILGSNHSYPLEALKTTARANPTLIPEAKAEKLSREKTEIVKNIIPETNQRLVEDDDSSKDDVLTKSQKAKLENPVSNGARENPSLASTQDATVTKSKDQNRNITTETEASSSSLKSSTTTIPKNARSDIDGKQVSSTIETSSAEPTTINRNLTSREKNEDEQFAKQARADEDRKTQSIQPEKRNEVSNEANKSKEIINQQIIVYRDTKKGWSQVSMSTLLSLGYLEEQINDLLPDALAIIVEEHIRRPRSPSLPAAWRIKPGSKNDELQIVETAKEADRLVDFLQKSNDKSTIRQSRSKPTKSTKDIPSTNRTKDKQSDDFNTTSNTTAIPSNVKIIKDQAELSKRKTASEAVVSETNSSLMPSSGVQFNETQLLNQVFLYKDMSGKLNSVSLANLKRLGYETKEILTLKQEALAIIVKDQIRRPQQAVPPQWQEINDQEIVVVDSQEEATNIIENEKASLRRQRTLERDELAKDNPGVTRRRRIPTPTKTNTVVDKTLERPSDRSRSRTSNATKKVPSSTAPEGPKRKTRLNSGKETKENRQRRRRPRNNRYTGIDDESNEEDPPRRIYNARQIPNRKERPPIADPPDPNSPIWTDIDTFRDLLRTEAELRLRILGNDWTETVKQESDWRLNLYKNWLWTLHNGMGESIVPPSRYERARRTNAGGSRTSDVERSRASSSARNTKKDTKKNRRPRTRRPRSDE